VDDILNSCGEASSGVEHPQTIEREGVTYTQTPRDRATADLRSHAWSFLVIYTKQGDGSGDSLVSCRLCSRLGASKVLFLARGSVSNAVKHFDHGASRSASPLKQLVHARAALLICRNTKGGNRTKRVVDGSIQRFFTSDTRPHHLRFVLMRVMTHSPYALAKNPYVDDFIGALSSSYSTPAPETVHHHLIELYACGRDAICKKVAEAKRLFSGLPFAHVVTDLWTEKHSRNSYSSVVIRFVRPDSTTMEVLHLGVALFAGKHSDDNIRKDVVERCRGFGVEESDICSCTSDSASNVRRALRDLMVSPWMPCIAHAMHNAVQYALGGTSETSVNDDEDGGSNRSLNPRCKALLTRVRKLIGHFNHSDRSVAIYRNLLVPGEEEARDIITDVVTRWSSTNRALARLYTCYCRLSAFFSHADVTSGARKRALTVGDWNRLRQIIGVLKGAFVVVTTSEGATEPISIVFELLCSFRRALFCDSFLVPAPPTSPVAVGKAAISAYCKSHAQKVVIEVDKRLYKAEKLYYESSSGRDELCPEAAKLVEVLRAKMQLRFFNEGDTTRDVMTAQPVLMATAVTPGGLNLIKKVSRMLQREGSHDAAIGYVRAMCDKFSVPPSTTAAADAPPSSVTDNELTAYNCMPAWSDDEDSRSAEALPSTQSLAARNDLEKFISACRSTKKSDPLLFWRQNKERFPTLHPVACASLGAVGTSASSEREFSVAAHIVRQDRSSMLARHVEMHSLILANATLLPGNLGNVPKLSHAVADHVRSNMPGGGRAGAANGEVGSDSGED